MGVLLVVAVPVVVTVVVAAVVAVAGKTKGEWVSLVLFGCRELVADFPGEEPISNSGRNDQTIEPRYFSRKMAEDIVAI